MRTIGSIYRDAYDELKKEGRQAVLAKVMREKGLRAGKKAGLKNTTGLRKALENLYWQNGIKAVFRETGKGLEIEIKECEWNVMEGWKPEHCASIEAYERGLAESLEKGLKHKCTARRSAGAKKCVLSIE